MRRAFTLLELLVVIAVIAVLLAILVPALGAARETGRRSRCLANLALIGKSGTLYSGDYRREMFIPTFHSADDNVGWFYPDYIPDTRTFICPSTRNAVHPEPMLGESFPEWVRIFGRDFPEELVFPALDRDSENGHSYEVWGWFSPGKFLDGAVMWGHERGTVGAQLGWGRDADPTLFTTPTQHVLKTQVTAPTPDRTILMLDSDQDGTPPGNAAGINNWPEPWNNHGRAGLNIGYADGHARWHRPDATLIKAYLDGYEAPPSNYQLVSPYRERQFTHRGARLRHFFRP